MICPATTPKQSFWVKIRSGWEMPQVLKCLLLKHDRWFRSQHPHQEARDNSRQAGKTDRSPCNLLTGQVSLSELQLSEICLKKANGDSERHPLSLSSLYLKTHVPTHTCTHTWQNDGNRRKYQLKMVYGKIVSETSMVKWFKLLKWQLPADACHVPPTCISSVPS